MNHTRLMAIAEHHAKEARFWADISETFLCMGHTAAAAEANRKKDWHEAAAQELRELAASFSAAFAPAE